MPATSKKKLILIPSKTMDKNKKSERNENGLVRMAATTRNFLGFDGDKVEVWTTGADSSSKPASVLLNIFKAYSADITELKKQLRTGDVTENEMKRIGFVTTKMYNRITGGDDNKNIWVSTGVHDTVIGADPEFLLFDSGGKVVHANGIMSKEGIIGCDGAMAEVRPPPSTGPEGLVKNIINAFSDKSLTAAITPYEWHCGCYWRNSSRDYPMGGHIHVGNPAAVARMTLQRREMFFNVLNKIIDELVAIPCIRLDGEMGRKRRSECQMANSNHGWGWFGEWRTCNGRLEHRSLSGMWLLHPSVAKCVLGTAKAVTDAVFKHWAEHGFEHKYVVPQKYEGLNHSDMNSGNFNAWKEFGVCHDMGTTMSSAELKKKLNESRGGDITKAYLSTWLQNMKRLETYSQYSKYIRGLREILKINMNELGGWDRKIQNNWLGSKKFIVDI